MSDDGDTKHSLDDTLAATESAPSRSEPRELHPRDASRYRVETVIGKGGMGRVLRAHDEHLNRPVAIKELLAADRDNIERRFQHEALVTAGLQHHGVVPVHDAGRWDNGAPFYAMKLVSGRPLHEIVAEADGLGGRLARLPELIDVAETIAYAHSEGVIHRDLKPANVMVGDYGETLVVDWGLAKRLRGAASSSPESSVGDAASTGDADPELTRAGDVLGTLLYMPPEQARGEAVDERADVYALGAMLYQLLTGFAPFRDQHRPDRRITRHTILRGTSTPVLDVEPDAPAELIAIVDKAMAADPGSRYASAAEVADELKRFQAGQLVGAHRYTIKELLGRWVRRHRVPLAVAAVAAVVLATVGVVAVYRIVRAEQRAVAERDRATEQQSLAQRAERVAVLERNRLRINQARTALDRDPTEALAWLVLDGEVTPAMLDDSYAIATDAVARGVARHVIALPDPAAELAVARNADVFAVATSRGLIQMWTTAGEPLMAHELGGPPVGLGVSDAGDALVAATADGRIAWWSRAGGVASVELPGGVRLVRLTPDGGRLFVLAPDGRARVVEASRPGENLLDWRADGATDAAAVAPSGRFVAIGHDDGRLTVQPIEAGASPTAWTAHRAAVVAVAIDEGDRLTTLGADGALRTWTAAGERVGDPLDLGAPSTGPLGVWAGGGAAGLLPPGQLAVWTGTAVGRHALPFSPDTPDRLADAEWTVVATGPDVRIFAPSYELSLRGHADRARARVTPSAIVTASNDASVRVWDRPPHPRARLAIEHPWTSPIPIGADRWIVGTEGGAVWSVHTDGTGAPQHDLGSQIVLADATADPERIAVATIDGRVVVYVDGRERLAKPAEQPTHLRLTNTAVAVVTNPGALRAWRLDDGTAIASAATVTEPGLLEIGPDDAVVALDARANLVVYEPTPRRIGSIGEAVVASARTGDGAILAGTPAGTLLHLGADGATRWRGDAHGGVIWDIAVSGYTAATAGGDGVVRLWNIADDGALTERHALRGHDRWVHGVAFSPDGRFVVSWSEGESRVRVWAVADGASRALRVPGRVRGASVSGDGAHIAVTDYDAGVFVFADWTPLPRPVDAGAAREWIRTLTSATISGAERLATPTR